MPSPVSSVTLILERREDRCKKYRTHWILECFKKFVVYFSVFLVVRPPDVLCLPPSIVSKWRGLRELGELREVRDEEDLRTVVEVHLRFVGQRIIAFAPALLLF